MTNLSGMVTWTMPAPLLPPRRCLLKAVAARNTPHYVQLREVAVRQSQVAATNAAADGSSREPCHDDDTALFAVNLRIIETLGQEVTDAGGHLAVVDATRYFNEGDEAVAAALKKLCATNYFGYVPVFEDLLDAKRRGVKTDWAHDGQFISARERGDPDVQP